MGALKNSTWKGLLQKYEYWHKWMNEFQLSLNWNMQVQGPEETGQGVKTGCIANQHHTKSVAVSHPLFLSSLAHEENK